MYYTVYQITNVINGKIYIGKHQTKDLNDGYMGSGKLIQRAIKKYGIENFQKKILFQFDTETKMNLKEAELVTDEFVAQTDNYNLCPGGRGGFGYINSNGLNGKRSVGCFRHSEETKRKMSLIHEERPSIIKKKIVDKRQRTTRKRYDSDWFAERSRKARLLSKTPEALQKRSDTFKTNQIGVGKKNGLFGKKRIKNEDTMEFSIVPKEDFQFWIDRGWTPGKFPNGVGTCIKYAALVERVNGC